MMKYVHKYLEMNCEMVFHIKMIQSRNLRVALFVISLNPLHAKFFRGNKNVYLHCMSCVHIDRRHVVEIFPQVRQEHTYAKKLISWVLLISNHDIYYVELN